MLAWHFSKKDGTLSDNRLTVVGETLTITGPPILCDHGLHASISALDALSYAPDTFIWRVDVTEDVIQGSDKIVGCSRKALWGFDATEVLLAFSRKCALEAINNYWDESRLGAIPPIVLEFLETGNAELAKAAAKAVADAYHAPAYAAHAAALFADAAAAYAPYAAADYASYAAAHFADAASKATARDTAAYVAPYTAAKARYSALLEEMLLTEAARLGLD